MPAATTRRILVDAVVVAAVSTLLTVVMAWPVLQAPGSRVFGPEIAGPHPDPFVIARHYERGEVPAPYLQPVTDLPGIALARWGDGLTAYNLLVLASFPMAAALTCVLGAVLTRSRLAGMIAAAVYTWAPFHMTHAAYHVHIAQVQWWPLAIVVLCVAVRQSWARGVITLAVPAILLVLSSFYWALAAVFVVPAALAALALAPHTLDPPASRRTALILLIIAVLLGVAGIAAAPWATDFDTTGFGAGDRAWYSARWFSLWLPAVTHPFLGRVSADIWAAAGAGPGLLEQQLGLGVGVLVLATVAVVRRWNSPSDPLVAAVPLLLAIGGAAWLASMYGGNVFGEMLPMFRAYARIGVVAVLALAVLAGAGGAVLWASRAGRLAVATLLVLVAFELYPVGGHWREALPTTGHRWIAAHAPDTTVLDCAAPGRVYGATVRAQMPGLMRFREPPFEDCVAPDIAGTLAAHGVTHVILRRTLREAVWLETGGSLEGLSIAARERDALVLRVDAAASGVYTTDIIGFHGREFSRSTTWRWMPAAAEWLVMNRTGARATVVLDLTAGSAAGVRTLRLTGPEGAPIDVPISTDGTYQVGPLTLPAGESRVRLRVLEGDVQPSALTGAPDDRRLAVRFFTWRWRLERGPAQ